MKRDKQKSAVYDWESREVAPHDKNPVPFAQIDSIVRHVWASEGLMYPPLVEKMPTRNKLAGDGCRTMLRFQSPTYTWIVLHEISHALTAECDGRTNKHGALFMGMYCQLLQRYLHLNIAELAETAQQAGLRVKLDATPVFI